MLSLRDKLKAAGAEKKRPEKPRAQDCFLRETRTPVEEFALEAELPGELLTFLQGREIPSIRREEICFLDTETTGLSHGAGTVAFLVGVGYFTPDEFVVRQYLMRDYDEEPFLLAHIAEHLKRCRVLCTFNGATFDMPLLEVRYTMQRMREQYTEKPHIDLLPISRRVWKLRLKKCNLSSLEEAVMGLRRADDLPGALVPERFFSYLQSRDFSLLEDVLRHIVQNIISLAHVLDTLLRMHDRPLQTAKCAEDLYSLGRIYEKRGRIDGARMCYRAADKGTLSTLARGKMADSYRRSGDWENAVRVYEKMIADRQGGIGPLIAMAKICEHKTKNLPAAIEYTRRAILLASDRDNDDMAALQKRYQRLLFKARKDD